MALRPQRIDRIRLNTSHPSVLVAFYRDALGFEPREGPPTAGVVGLRLGSSLLDIVDVGPGVTPYPADLPGWDMKFQHCAIRTSDLDRSMARLRAVAGWRPISTLGPERLPERSGGVVAFKFRDPEGHPLEFLSDPDTRSDAREPNLGIDHSAISVADTLRSLTFYEGLGFSVTHRGLNLGPEQARLDAVPGAEVEITGLSLGSGEGPDLELLCYRGQGARDETRQAETDIAATRLILVAPEASGGLIRDPDGHMLQFEPGPSA